jgi:hypothetical protein
MNSVLMTKYYDLPRISRNNTVHSSELAAMQDELLPLRNTNVITTIRIRTSPNYIRILSTSNTPIPPLSPSFPPHNTAIFGNGLFFTSSNHVLLLPSSECSTLVTKSSGISRTIAFAASITRLDLAPADASTGPADRDRRNGNSFITRGPKSTGISSLSTLLSGLKRLSSSAELERTMRASLVGMEGGLGSEGSGVGLMSGGFQPMAMRSLFRASSARADASGALAVRLWPLPRVWGRVVPGMGVPLRMA